MKQIEGHKVLGIYDYGDTVADRYTIVLNEGAWVNDRGNTEYDALGLSSSPESPLGFSQWVSAVLGDHLGKRIRFEALPSNVQEHIIKRLQTV